MSQLELSMPLVMPATDMPLHGAVISPCGLYRYVLTRTWDRTLPPLVWCMLNPSTADGTVDDPTIRKCVGFAKRLGCGGIVVVNLFAFRATDPKELLRARADHRALQLQTDIVGPDNDVWIKHAFGIGARQPVCGWGSFAGLSTTLELRVNRVLELARAVGATTYTIGVNEKTKSPKHPLMTAYTTPMTEWR